MPTKTDQWPDCSDKQRARVHGINLAIKDMLDPCQLADQLGVQLTDLWSYEVRDGGIGGGVLNYIYRPGAEFALKSRRKPKPKARPKQSRRSPRRHR